MPAERIGTEDIDTASRREALMPAFRESCARNGVQLSLAIAIARKETGIRNIPSAPGQRDDILGGSYGPMQVSSDRARIMGIQPQLGLKARGTWLLEDPSRGIEAGCMYVKALMRRGATSLEMVCAGYNGGPRWVDKQRIAASTQAKYLPYVRQYQLEYAHLDTAAT